MKIDRKAKPKGTCSWNMKAQMQTVFGVVFSALR